MHKKQLLAVFAVMAIAQLFIPGKMIYDREHVLSQGKEFRFRTQPIDPNDPFRGKYINLRFKANEVRVKDYKSWQAGGEGYATLITDKNGYAKINSLSVTKPEGHDYIKVIANGYYLKDEKVNITFPFERFYMEESKAPVAEVAYAESAADTLQVAYAVVMVKDGESVIRDVMINGESIKSIVEKRSMK